MNSDISISPTRTAGTPEPAVPDVKVAAVLTDFWTMLVRNPRLPI
jgi:hypothetical protein